VTAYPLQSSRIYRFESPSAISSSSAQAKLPLPPQGFQQHPDPIAMWMQRWSATSEPPLRTSSSPPMAPLLLIAAMASPPMTVRASLPMSAPTAPPRTPPVAKASDCASGATAACVQGLQNGITAPQYFDEQDLLPSRCRCRDSWGKQNLSL
jgi:hypothetical protein